MSRSHKHLPIQGLAPADSEKAEKQQWHRRLRRVERQHLAVLTPDAAEDHVTLTPREVSDPWQLPKHGKAFALDPVDTELALRK